jgi:phage shock protein E
MKYGLLIGLLMFNSLAFANPVWIDVRTVEEKQANGIDGDVLIPFNEIVPKVTELHPDKSTEIYLYCRTGNRSGLATQALTKAGYTHVINAGSIEDARSKRGLDK